MLTKSVKIVNNENLNKFFFSENENVSLGYPDLESLKIYIDSQNFLQEYKLKFDNFIKSDTMKKFKFEAQKTINLPINAISHVSREQLIDKYDKLKTFLSGKGSPNILLNPEAEAFSKHLLAKKIVVSCNFSLTDFQFLLFIHQHSLILFLPI